MDRSRISAWLPYAVMLAAAAFFWFVANRIEYAARPGAIGPDFWPKAALLLIGVTCIYEIGKVLLLGSAADARGLAGALEAEEEQEDEGPRHTGLLVAGSALTIAYGLLISWIGFPLATFLYLVVFMYVGRYRAHAVIWLSAALGTAVFCTLFLKIVYVSLPRGVPPFDRITDLIVNLF
jgi:putative tricarboxylic transport membrane protein